MASPFADHRDAARAILNGETDIGWRAGQFLGGIIYADRPLTDRQLDWLAKLLERAGLPPLSMGGAHG